MTEFSRRVLERLQLRKSRRQKKVFAAEVAAYAQEQGYASRTERGSFGAQNIIVGDPEAAEVVYTAHYDTCALLPFPNFLTPKNVGIYLLYQLAISVLMLLPALVLQAAIHVWVLPLLDPEELAFYLLARLPFIGMLLLAMFLMMAGPASRHTANDNTSGVITLLEIMAALPQEERARVAFIFFDLEEMGLFGSGGFAARHKKAMKHKLLVNFDCVSDGAHFLFVLRRGARAYEETLKAAFLPDEGHSVELASRGVIYPSDQAKFPCGVGVAAFKRTRRGLLYMDRIHTTRDTVFCEDNITCLTAGAVRLVEVLSAKAAES